MSTIANNSIFKINGDPRSSAEWKLCLLIKHDISIYGKPHNGGMMMHTRMTTSEIADKLGFSKRTIAEAFSNFKKLGVIFDIGDYIFVPDTNSIEEYLRYISS